MYNVIDLFAGAGGLSLGFRQAGEYCIKVAFENNPAMQETYKLNHPGVDVRGDVCNADYAEIQEKYGPIDVVIGGPPCQGFSNANRQKNHIVSRNNSLVKEYVRAILELKPKAFVMENVSMLRSETHRFYLSGSDKSLVDDDFLTTKSTPILLLDSDFVFNGIENIVRDAEIVNRLLWPDRDYDELNVIYKAKKNQGKLIEALKKHEERLKAVAGRHICGSTDSEIEKADERAFSAVADYYKCKVDPFDLLRLIEPAIMYQQMLGRAHEILANNLVVDGYRLKGDLYADVKSFAVLDYVKAKLETGEGVNGYAIVGEVLSAADFGAPQKRLRFVLLGIRKDVSTKSCLPKGAFAGGTYRTVHDAISDLEDVQPVFDTADDAGIRLEPKKNLSDLAKSLRNVNVLKNHLITKTTNVALERFKALKQGENFHALDDSLKTNTYTDISRTQNTVYSRLNYNEPSGTVLNVRKSMWVHPVKDRAISVREAARLQTFPDSFIFCGTKDQQYQQVGNAVPPVMAKAIARELAKQLKKHDHINASDGSGAPTHNNSTLPCN